MAISDLLKLFSSAFGTAQFLPCLLASLGAVWGLPLIVHKGDPLQLLGKLQPMDATQKVAAAVGAAIVLSVVFKILESPQVRFYQGYIPSAAFWKPFVARQKAKRRRLVRDYKKLRKIHKAKRSPDQQARLNKVATELDLRHARQERFVLGTRLGNVFRAFEGYPNERYAFDGVAMLPRIQPLLPEPARVALTTAQSNVDMLLTTATLWLAAAGVIVSFEPFSPRTSVLVASAAVAAYLCYAGAIVAALSLGLAVRGAFDIGREPLLKALGLEMPASLAAERALWEKVTLLMVYNLGDGGRPPADLPDPPSRDGTVWLLSLIAAGFAIARWRRRSGSRLTSNGVHPDTGTKRRTRR